MTTPASAFGTGQAVDASGCWHDDGTTEPHVVLHRKLVRDRIPDLIQSQGGGVEVRALDEAEVLPALVAKLHEEATELGAAGPADRLAELADVREVLSALVAHLGFTEAQVARAARDKRAERGGFEGRIWLEATRDRG
ncbi:Predicted house-cleaning noncanonical NTP pyrophosphatase, all-alpha NTP-PPase (MazG) superfamily [Micromonospora nigra]|uniref:Predicted house-cleaning noncanonical NTP pyrophosphatase, all-alpha NTP-PPase (MazG) superfamily n=1 Tax=Micromonospora nigra TaxID=145857 RepID=A0A1C6S645_9ACTN|nr:nucleoside triphosphate pyrophosphohydrolase [Micromonospora nigra]SCL24746.1 Predicted house-cleaning noncanonical NTP pyrophosphatase, all-alpha NTP-PPase (MazG) superfamily [Micromonospora nigra]